MAHSRQGWVPKSALRWSDRKWVMGQEMRAHTPLPPLTEMEIIGLRLFFFFKIFF